MQKRTMEVMVRVRQRGALTLPVKLRAKHGIGEGDIFRLIDLNGMLVLTPMTPMLPELAREIERARVEKGLSMDEMLKGLRQQRKRYHKEKYS